MTEPGSIDDLFSGGADTTADRGHGRTWHVRALSLLAWGAVVAALAFVALRLVELTAPVPVLLAASVALVLIWRLSKRLRPPPAPRQAGRHHEEKVTVQDGLRLAIARWDTLLDWSHSDARRFNRKVVPRIAEVVDERLRQRHGITRTGDPQRARQIIGDPLWTLLTEPSRRAPHPSELDQLVTALEKI